jgi:hypothetical protein
MILKINSRAGRLALKLPRCLFHVERCRVGADYMTYIKVGL